MKPQKITAESTAHSANGKACGILFDVTAALTRALGVKHLRCSGCSAVYALKIGEG